jgi:hypothetical protein
MFTGVYCLVRAAGAIPTAFPTIARCASELSFLDDGRRRLRARRTLYFTRCFSNFRASVRRCIPNLRAASEILKSVSASTA